MNATWSRIRSPLAPAIGPLLILAFGLGMLHWTWLAWPDVLIDSGREAYLPWRLAGGQVLYRDLASFNGPLSPYLNALAMRILGPTIRTLLIINALVITLLSILIYRGARTVAGPLAATLACVTFLALFCFGQLSYMDSCSFMFPYSHEMTHGALILFSMAGLFGWYQSAGDAAGVSPRALRRPLILAGIGLLLGLLFLTKPELFVGGVAMLAIGLGLTWWHEAAIDPQKPGAGKVASTIARNLSILAIPALVPVLIAFGLLALAMPAGAAAKGTLGAWAYLGDSRVTDLLYFKIWMGTYDPVDSLRRMMFTGLAWLIAILPGAILSWRFSKRFEGRKSMILAAGYAMALVTIAVSTVRDPNQWLDFTRPLPIALIVLGVIWSYSIHRRWNIGTSAPGSVRQSIFMLAMIGFSLAMLLKLGLYPRVWHYGFVLGLPGVLVVVVSLVDHFPRWLWEQGRNPLLVRVPVLAVWLIYVAGHLWVIHGVLAGKPVIVGDGGNVIRADGRGVAVGELMDGLSQHVPPDATLAVLPEGVMLNVLTHRVNPTPYTFLLPSDMVMFGEERVIAAYNAHPPDYIVLAHRNTAEYGFTFFGQDYGTGLTRWISAHYSVVGQVGEVPLRDRQKFGFLILKKIPDANERLMPMEPRTK